MSNSGSRRGAALIVVLGVLTILALLGITFNSLARLDHEVASSYLDTVRARLIARAGVDHAISILEVTDLSADPTWMGDPSEPVEKADRPSFHQKDGSGNPLLLKIEGEDCGYTDLIQTGATEKSVFSVFVRDANGLLHVNDGAAFGSNHSVSRNLRRMLRVLGTLKGVPASLTDRIVDDRPAMGWRSKYEIRTAMGDAEAFAQIKDFLTVGAWQDTRVAEPVPLSKDALGSYPADITYQRGGPVALYRYGRNKNAFNEVVASPLLFYSPGMPLNDPRIAVYGLDELNPMYVELTSRAPISVNSAPREVLVAVLSGLQGFFLAEDPALTPGKAFQVPGIPGHLGSPVSGSMPWTGEVDHYGASAKGGSMIGRIGLLIATEAISGPAGPIASTTSSVPNSAVTIADEMIACRNRTAGPAGFNYGSAAFGGPFRNWAQFNLFCDNLARLLIVRDTRAGLSAGMQAQGTQAIADMIKANFNPNLHLNELNPDANLHLKVDKTDLIVHSTEFCFMPPGRFEIESLGRNLRTSGGTSAMPNHTVRGEAKALAVVKLWDSYRQTSQKQFTAGSLQGASLSGRGFLGTNNARALEIGPEPDHGKAAAEADYAGYIAFSTVGGTGGLPNGGSTTAQSPVFGEGLRVSFQRDFEASHHFQQTANTAFRYECARRNTNVVSNEEADRNFPRPTEGSLAGPYDGQWSMNSSMRPRLARQFYTPAYGTSTATPNLVAMTASDLRIDGCYSERGSAPSYLAMKDISWQVTRTTVSETVSGSYGSCPTKYYSYSRGGSSENNSATGWELFPGGRGAVSFWVKPSFAPEHSAKVRSFFDYSRWHDTCSGNQGRKSPFGLWFLPMQGGTGSFADPRSMIFAGSIPTHDVLRDDPGARTRFAIGRYAPGVNNLGLAKESTSPSVLKANQWAHVQIVFDVQSGSTVPSGSTVYLNNKLVGSGVLAGTNLGPEVSPAYRIFYHDPIQVSRGPVQTTRYRYRSGNRETVTGTRTTQTTTIRGRWANTVRLGNTSRILDATNTQNTPYNGNFAADATFDELYCWRDASFGQMGGQAMWSRGRYSAAGLNPSSAWVSDKLILTTSSSRRLQPSTKEVPSGAPVVTPPGITGAAAMPVVLRGLAYTWYGEETVGTGPGGRQLQRVLWNYRNPYMNQAATGVTCFGTKDQKPGSPIRLNVEVAVLADGNPVRTCVDDGYSLTQFGYDPATTTLRYRIRFVPAGSMVSPLLLATPVFDDITFYYTITGDSRFLEYTMIASG